MGFMREPLPTEVQELLRRGSFSEAKSRILKLLEGSEGLGRLRLLFELERMERVLHEYPYTVEEAFELFSREVSGLTREEFISLIRAGCVAVSYTHLTLPTNREV